MIYRSVTACVQNLLGLARRLESETSQAFERYEEANPDLRVEGRATGVLEDLEQVQGSASDLRELFELLATDLPRHRADLGAVLDTAHDNFTRALSDLGTIQTSLGALDIEDDEGGIEVRSAIQTAAEIDCALEEALQEINELRAEEGTRSSLAGLRRTVDDVSAYPILTRETAGDFGGGVGGAGGGSSAGGGKLGLAAIVQTTARDVLGWRPRTEDTRGFLAAVKQSYLCEEKDGRSVCTYQPRNFTVQADLGAITGAQASLYTRAKAALDASAPIVERLEALRADDDEEDVKAARNIVGASFRELVDEFGRSGGPRVQRVESLFERLLGIPMTQDAEGADDVQGALGQLRESLGLERDRVNDTVEEQNLTNFVILVDHVESLRASWQQHERYFRRDGGEVYLGTQLVLLSRALAVCSESAGEVAAAMDSVFLGEAERQTLRLSFTEESPLYVQELLEWVDSFCSEEARELIRDGGRAGVRSLLPTLERLSQLVSQSRVRSSGGQQNPNTLPSSFSTPRVQRALHELYEQLEESRRIAEPLR